MRPKTYAAGALLLAATLTLAGCGAGGSDDAATAPSAAASSTGASTAAPSSAAAPGAGSSGAAQPSRTAAAPSAPGTPSYSITVPDLQTAHDRGIVEGGDASWPQCPKGMGIPQKRTEGKPMPLPSAEFVILGLTNGPGFHPNPCLADQVAWVKKRHLMAAAYSIISYPVGDQLETYGGTGPYDASTSSGRLANVGYQEALFNLRTMKRARLTTPIVWLDIEPVADFDWPSDTGANAAVVQGAMRGYTDAGFRVGVYSLESLWTRVVGDLRLTVPEWRPAGGTSRAEALRRCGADWMFQGGSATLVQWVEDDRDRDVTCPGASAYLTLWFHAY